MTAKKFTQNSMCSLAYIGAKHMLGGEQNMTTGFTGSEWVGRVTSQTFVSSGGGIPGITGAAFRRRRNAIMPPFLEEM